MQIIGTHRAGYSSIVSCGTALRQGTYSSPKSKEILLRDNDRHFERVTVDYSIGSNDNILRLAHRKGDNDVYLNIGWGKQNIVVRQARPAVWMGVINGHERRTH